MEDLQVDITCVCEWMVFVYGDYFLHPNIELKRKYKNYKQTPKRYKKNIY